MSTTKDSRTKLLVSLREQVLQLHQTLKEEIEQREALTLWIQSKLKPGLQKLRLDVYDRLDAMQHDIELLNESSAELNKNLDIERLNRKKLSIWMKESFGSNLEILDQRVCEVLISMTDSPSKSPLSGKNAAVYVPKNTEEWLISIGYDRYQDSFQSLNLEQISRMDERALLKLGVTLKRHREDFLVEIAKLKSCLRQQQQQQPLSSEEQHSNSEDGKSVKRSRKVSRNNQLPSDPSTDPFLESSVEEELLLLKKVLRDKDRAIEEERLKTDERMRQMLEREQQLKAQEERNRLLQDELQRKELEERRRCQEEQQQQQQQQQLRKKQKETEKLKEDKQKSTSHPTPDPLVSAPSSSSNHPPSAISCSISQSSQLPPQSQSQSQSQSWEPELQETKTQSLSCDDPSPDIDRENINEPLRKLTREEEEREKISLLALSQRQNSEKSRSQSKPKQSSETQLENEKELKRYVDRVKDDEDPIDWALFAFDAASNLLVFDSMGKEGHQEFLDHLADDKCQFGILRLVDGENSRIKFVMVTWVGSKVRVVVSAKCNTKKALASKAIGAVNADINAMQTKEPLALNLIWEKIKAKVNF